MHYIKNAQQSDCMVVLCMRSGADKDTTFATYIWGVKLTRTTAADRTCSVFWTRCRKCAQNTLIHTRLQNRAKCTGGWNLLQASQAVPEVIFTYCCWGRLSRVWIYILRWMLPLNADWSWPKDLYNFNMSVVGDDLQTLSYSNFAWEVLFLSLLYS